MTKLIVGLGNPGSKYEKNRHNVGFIIVDSLKEELEDIQTVNFDRKTYLLKGSYNSAPFFLLKPMTFMNLSGDAVRKVVDYYKIDYKEILVVYDDLDLDLGVLRLRYKGSAGGHNGLKDILQKLGTNEIKRLRIGIGRPQDKSKVISYVLSDFTKQEMNILEKIKEISKEVLLKFIQNYNFDKLMSEYNKINVKV